jgi:hypothetical protein
MHIGIELKAVLNNVSMFIRDTGNGYEHSELHAAATCALLWTAAFQSCFYQAQDGSWEI